ncbi:MAG: radical SAM protein [Chloroflexota bacterium]|nr:radical SAM protein [Chloroflexota bacterium]
MNQPSTPRYANRTHGLPAPPIVLREIDINVTNLCNLTCIYCSYSSTPGKHEPTLPKELIHRVLDEAAALGNRVVHFSGGEPVIRPDMPELIGHASGLGFKMRMHSNGALLRREKLETLWQAGLRQVLVSLDGFEDNHGYHRSDRQLFPKTMAAIRNASELGFDVRVNSVATVRNVDELPKLLPVLADMGVATFSVFYMIPVGRGREVADLMVPPKRWRSFIEAMQATAALHRPGNMEVTVEKVFQWEDEQQARGLIQSGRGGSCLGFLQECNYVNILSDGRVYPCVCFLDEAPALGNVFDSSLEEILFSPDSWDFYWSMKGINQACAGCSKLDTCRGGSRALSRFALGDWFALDPRCSGDPQAQGFIPLCFMVRENVATRVHSGFAERVTPRQSPA